ncbi:hypothetical protein RhiirC2_802060, partial [Rhizophagus irregularis]
MANIIDFRFKLHDKSDDEIFIIKIAWQTLVKDAIPTIKKGMETLYRQVPDEIKLCVDNPKELTTELKPDDMISKHFNIDHIEEVKGNTLANAFSVKISRDEPISELKKAIKAEKAPEFDSFPADKLKLWK